VTGADVKDSVPAARTRGLHSRPVLLAAFAFAVMADPVSSVAYAIEGALRGLRADLGLLLPTMGLVVGIIALVIVNYQQIVARYPTGGGASAAVGEAFGEGYAFVPVGALIVDFVLTIAISASAAASAVIAYLPALAPWRVPLALGLIAAVAGLTWPGHLGRAVFALMTLGFVATAAAVLAFGMTADPHPTGTISTHPPHHSLLAVALAFPVAMALATGVEAPSSAIAQLGQLDNPGRRRFGKITLWLTLAVVGTLTLALTAQAVRLHIGVPTTDTTQIAELARTAAPGPLFAGFQLVTTLLLLAAASSSFQAGPGLLKALAQHTAPGGQTTGILPGWLGRTNRHHTPYWGVLLFTLATAAVTTAAGGHDQSLVLFYAVSVFISFLSGLIAMARFAHHDHHPGSLALNLTGVAAVGFTLAVNLTRLDAIVSVSAALLVAALLYRMWVRAGRPGGISSTIESG
jgi:amino acid transporter